MSWDIFVQNIPQDVKTVGDIPSGFEPRSIGKRSLIISKILEVVPTADFTDPSWGIIQGSDWSIEVNIGKAETCKGFAFHVRGADIAAGVVGAILDHLKLRAVDSQTGEFLKVGPDAMKSFQEWRSYRNRVAKDPSQKNRKGR